MTITFTNNGKVEHNFSVTSNGLSVDKDAEAGHSETVTFTPTQAGTIQFFCKYHKASYGMIGTLTVSSGSGGSGGGSTPNPTSAPSGGGSSSGGSGGY